MKIMLTCAGRRNYLARFVKEVLGTRGQVIACDASDSAPAFVESDLWFTVPPLDHPHYLDELLSICREQRVRLLLSVNDLELEGLARRAPEFRAVGTIPVVSSPQVIALCQDKWAAFQFLRACDIPTPDTYSSLSDVRQALANGAISFPLMLKPRWGTSSIGVEYIDNERELVLAYEWGKVHLQRTIIARLSQADPDSCFVFQKYVPGKEYGLDIVNDLNGTHVCTWARRKLVMRAGNTDRACTVVEPRLARLGEVIGRRLSHVGCLDCDLIVTDNACQVLDLNPRLGGGYPFSHLAGANLPAMLLAWASEAELDPSWLEPRAGVLSSKYDGVVVVNRQVPIGIPTTAEDHSPPSLPAPSPPLLQGQSAG